LTRIEYDNTIRDLLGDTNQPAATFVAEDHALGFNNNAYALGVGEVLAEQFLVAAETLSTRAVANLAKLLPCTPTPANEDACAQRFIDSFGQRAFRRPLDSMESSRFFQLYTTSKQGVDFAAGVRLVIEAMLLSPHFVYRVELVDGPGAGSVVNVNPWELASRISYLLWATMPDDLLFQAAASGQLATPAQVAAHARRMLADPRARSPVANFHDQWLQLDLIDTVTKDASVFPAFTTAVQPLLHAETAKFLDYVTWDGPGDLTSMFTAPFTFLNEPLAAFYASTGPIGSEFQRTMLDGTRRAGFLTQGSILAALAKPNQTSPVQRGKFVQEQLLCNNLPAPPANVEITLPEPSPTATTRERFSQHSSLPACASCHSLMDPIGLGFEHYDGSGRWRDSENGVVIDASGVVNDSDVDGPFVGAIELANRLGHSGRVRACFVRQWFRFAYGRADTPSDQCTMATLTSRFAEGNANVRELLVALTQSDAFLYRPASRAGGGP
jgi:hypothetical protein